jgi:hypothetical protein
MVVIAFGTHILVFLQIVFVQNGFATRAFDPQAFGNAAPVSRIGVLNFGGKQFFKPTHISTPEKEIMRPRLGVCDA